MKAYVFICKACGKIFFLNEKEEIIVHCVSRNHSVFSLEKIFLPKVEPQT